MIVVLIGAAWAVIGGAHPVTVVCLALALLVLAGTLAAALLTDAPSPSPRLDVRLGRQQQQGAVRQAMGARVLIDPAPQFGVVISDVEVYASAHTSTTTRCVDVCNRAPYGRGMTNRDRTTTTEGREAARREARAYLTALQARLRSGEVEAGEHTLAVQHADRLPKAEAEVWYDYLFNEFRPLHDGANRQARAGASGLIYPPTEPSQ